MIVYRIAKTGYKDDLSGIGAKLFGSRWNYKGTPMLFTAEYISLAALEILVHLNLNEIPDQYYLIFISIPDEIPMAEIKTGKLKPSWQNDQEYTAFMGNEFLQQKNSLYLKVPSAIIQEEHNYIFNPLHRDFNRIKITKTKLFDFDKRLLYKIQ